MDIPTSGSKRSLKAFLPKGRSLSDLPDEMVADLLTMYVQPGGEIADRFTARMLGFGSTGAVYKVTERFATEGDSAVKMLLPTLTKDEGRLREFMDEYAVFQELDHPNIVRVYDHGEAEGFTYFAMDFVRGDTLKRWVTHRGGHVPIKEALKVALQICDGLSYAHKRTIHGDLKPQNIIVQADGTVKLVDFAVAKLMNAEWMTRSSEALGTAWYVAPELMTEGVEADVRADVYSLGTILYEMFTGKERTGKVYLAASEWNRKVPAALDTLIDRMLDPDPDKRPGSIDEVTRWLRKVARRKRRRIAACAAVGLVMIAAVAGGYRIMSGRRTAGREPGLSLSAVESRDRLARPVLPDEAAPAVAALLEDTTSLLMTAGDVVSVRNQAREQRNAAERLDAVNLVPDLFNQAVHDFEQGEEYERTKTFDKARAAYESSLGMFVRAAEEAKRTSDEIGALEFAKATSERAKVYAETQQGATYAPERYAEAEAKRAAAERQQSRTEAADLYREAERLYLLAYVDAGDAMGRSVEDGARGHVTGEPAESIVESGSTGPVTSGSESVEEDQTKPIEKPPVTLARAEPVVPEPAEPEEDPTASPPSPQDVTVPDMRINLIRPADDANPTPVAVVSTQKSMYKVYEGDPVGDTGVRVVKIYDKEIRFEYQGAKFFLTFR